MNVLIDTGFWYAYYDGSDEHHEEALKIMDRLEIHRILIPYPSLYETIDTRFCKRKEWLAHFSRLINSEHCALIPDDSYKAISLELSVFSSLNQNRAISLVDMVIRQMIEDINLKTDVVITFNPGDFVDLCRMHKTICVTDSSMASVLG